MSVKDIGKTLKELRLSAHMSQKQAYEYVGVAQSTFSSWETGKAEPPTAILVKLCQLYKVDNVLTAFGYDGYNDDGSIYLNMKEEEVIEKYRSLDDYGRETVDIILDRESRRIKAAKVQSVQSAKIIRLSYYQKLASAGNGEYIFDDIPIDTIEVPLDEISEKADFVIGVNGNSMEPTYYDGDKVFVERCQIVETGEIGVFMVNNECLIKEFGKDGLISHNKEYKIIPGTEDIQCIGKVLGKVSFD